MSAMVASRCTLRAAFGGNRRQRRIKDRVIVSVVVFVLHVTYVLAKEPFVEV